jgi:hypothetical protein
MGRECGACVSHTLGLGPPRAIFIWQLSLPVASTVAMRNVCLTSIHAIQSLATNARSGARPKSARAGYSPADEAVQHDGDEHVASQARRSGNSLAPAIGSNLTRSNLRTSMLELRRPVIAAWASFVCSETGDNVVELRRAGA